MPRTPLALVPLGEKDKEDVLLRYYIHVHSMLTMFVIINIPDVHITRQVRQSINISKTTRAHLICERCGCLVCGGFCRKKILDFIVCLMFLWKLLQSHSAYLQPQAQSFPLHSAFDWGSLIKICCKGYLLWTVSINSSRSPVAASYYAYQY